MSYSEVDLRPAIQFDETTRGDFVVRVYQHLLGAIVAFAAIEALFINLGISERIYNFVARGGGLTWLLVCSGPPCANASRDAEILFTGRARFTRFIFGSLRYSYMKQPCSIL